MLCYVMLCHVTPRHATLRYVTLRYVMLCYVMLSGYLQSASHRRLFRGALSVTGVTCCYVSPKKSFGELKPLHKALKFICSHITFKFRKVYSPHNPHKCSASFC